MVETDVSGELRRLIADRAQLPPPHTCRGLREINGLTLEDIATSVGVTPQAVSNWERGTRSPRGVHRARYLEALAVLRESGGAA